jgi:hypothetical protein
MTFGSDVVIKGQVAMPYPFTVSSFVLDFPHCWYIRVMLNYTRTFLNRRLVYRYLFPKDGIGAEIGVLHGQNACVLVQETSPRKLHLIDRWDAGLKAGPGRDIQMRCYQNAVEAIEPHASIVQIHKGWSQDVVDEFPDDYFDWVYIDACHQYEGVSGDLQSYYPKVKIGGVLAGHDFARPIAVRKQKFDQWRQAKGYPSPTNCEFHDHAGVRKAVHEILNGRKCELLGFSNEHFRSFAMRRMV